MIVINALAARGGGGQSYLLRLFSCIPPDLRDHVIVIAHVSNQHLWEPFGLQIITSASASKSLTARIWFENVGLPRLIRHLGGAVYVASGGLLPWRKLRNVKTVAIFDNMLPFAPREMRRYPLGYMRFCHWLLRAGLSSSFKKADILICVSQYAQDVIQRALPVRKGKLAIIPHAPHDDFRYQTNRPLPQEMKGEYVLYVSSVSVYKAQLEVVQAWYLLRQQRETKEKLILLGPQYPYYAKKVKTLIQNLHLENEVILVEKLPYEELPAYYQHAKINLFASSCENCPNILLEALAAARPVFCSNYQPMPEFGGDAVEFFDPYAPEELTQLLMKYLDDEHGRARLGEKASQQSQQFQWRESAAKTWNLLADLLEKG